MDRWWRSFSESPDFWVARLARRVGCLGECGEAASRIATALALSDRARRRLAGVSWRTPGLLTAGVPVAMAIVSLGEPIPLNLVSEESGVPHNLLVRASLAAASECCPALARSIASLQALRAYRMAEKVAGADAGLEAARLTIIGSRPETAAALASMLWRPGLRIDVVLAATHGYPLEKHRKKLLNRLREFERRRDLEVVYRAY